MFHCAVLAVSAFHDCSSNTFQFYVLVKMFKGTLLSKALTCMNFFLYKRRLVPHVDKAPLPLRILRLVTSNFLPVENPTHPTAHAPERASVYILGQFRTSK